MPNIWQSLKEKWNNIYLQSKEWEDSRTENQINNIGNPFIIKWLAYDNKYENPAETDDYFREW